MSHIFFWVHQKKPKRKGYIVLKKGKNHFSRLWKIENTMEIHRYYQKATIFPILEELGGI